MIPRGLSTAVDDRGVPRRTPCIRPQWRSGPVRRAAVLLTAAGIDAVLGEPQRGHPVRAFGRFLSAVRRRRSGDSPRDRRLGATALVVGVAGAGAAGMVADRLAARAPFPLALPLRALVLKPAFAIRALLDAGETVRSALVASDLDAARVELGARLVSRPVHDLGADEVAAATIESLAENLTDSVVAPLLAAAVGGPAAAWAYRFVNTADAMLGYRTAELRDVGAASARVDDALNLVPARIGAVLVGVAAPAGGGNTVRALRAALRDHARTASPNAGWTMAAMAGALEVTLSKRGAYTLNARGRAAGAPDIARASRIVAVASGLALVLSSLLAARIAHRSSA